MELQFEYQNDFDDKRGITDQEFQEADKRRRQEYLKSKQIMEFRITVGGSFYDFDDEAEAFEFLREQIKLFSYASIHMMKIKTIEVTI